MKKLYIEMKMAGSFRYACAKPRANIFGESSVMYKFVHSGLLIVCHDSLYTTF
uniref:Uncharacterized protein n=1 Tax=Arundo donax TaxID=35708 RepID=A0A0A8YXL0_ARUDO